MLVFPPLTTKVGLNSPRYLINMYMGHYGPNFKLGRMSHYSNTFFIQVGFMALANMFSWVVEKRNGSQNKVIFPISHLSNLEFLGVFLKIKQSPLYTPQMALSDHSMVYNSSPRHSNVLPSFIFSYL